MVRRTIARRAVAWARSIKQSLIAKK